MRWSSIFSRKRAAAARRGPSPSLVDPFDLLAHNFDTTSLAKLAQVVDETSAYRCSTAVLSTPDDQIAVALAYVVKTVLSYAEQAIQLASCAPNERFNPHILVIVPTISIGEYFIEQLCEQIDREQLFNCTGYRTATGSTHGPALVRDNSTIMIMATDAMRAQHLVEKRMPNSLIVLSADRVLFGTTRGAAINRTVIAPHAHNIDSTTSICLLSALTRGVSFKDLPSTKENTRELSPRILQQMAKHSGQANDVLL